jgi:EAL and modified HD-GYP domain-containing signal transduction protein
VATIPCDNPKKLDCEWSRETLAPVSAAMVVALVADGSDNLRYVARQPILDMQNRVHGYELLFRAGPTSVQFSGDSDGATRSVLDHTVLFGLERLTGGMPAFVNCTQEALLNRLVMVLPPDKTVLELLETLEPTTALIEACAEFKALGFRLALDDFAWSEAWQPLLELADYIKVDLSQTTPKERTELVARVRGQSKQLVMERVETQADLELAKKEGFTLFQGYFFCRPVLMENRTIPANKLAHIEMLRAIAEMPMDVKRISNLVKLDASLTYRLLRMVNSPVYATRKEVTSIHGALVMIGDEMFRRVALLAIASKLGNPPSELLRMAFLRGRFCEMAAAMTGLDPTEQYLLGVLSLLPAMLRVPMESVAKTLPLRGAVREALLGHSNAERTVLDWLGCYEMGLWERCDQLAKSCGPEAGRLPQLYSEALLWAEANMTAAMI